MIDKAVIAEKMSQIEDYWHPHIIAELNGQHVKLAKIKGEFPWHKHEVEDELFQIIKGKMLMRFRDKSIPLEEQELIVVPKGIEHSPMAEEECWILLFEPAGTLNTGDQPDHALSRHHINKI